jgi:hypothetical protein
VVQVRTFETNEVLYTKENTFDPLHTTHDICCLKALTFMHWIYFKFDKISDRDIYRHLSIVITNYSWLFYHRNSIKTGIQMVNNCWNFNLLQSSDYNGNQKILSLNTAFHICYPSLPTDDEKSFTLKSYYSYWCCSDCAAKLIPLFSIFVELAINLALPVQLGEANSRLILHAARSRSLEHSCRYTSVFPKLTVY